MAFKLKAIMAFFLASTAFAVQILMVVQLHATAPRDKYRAGLPIIPFPDVDTEGVCWFEGGAASKVHVNASTPKRARLEPEGRSACMG